MVKPISNRVVLALAVIAVTALLPAPGRADNPHFLDRNSGEARRALQSLRAKAESGAGPDVLADLGWVQLLYACDPDAARRSFHDALAKDENHLRALEGLLLAAQWKGEEREAGGAVLEIVKRVPTAPAAMVIVRNTDPLPTWYNTPTEKRAAFEEALRKAPPELARALREDLVESLQNAGREEEAHALWLANGNVPHWLCVGCLGEGGVAAFDDVLPPEETIDLEAVYRVGMKTVRWGRLDITAHDYDLGDCLRRKVKGEGTVLFLLTYARLPSDTPVVLRTRLYRSHKVYVNGVEVGAADRFTEKLPNQLGFGTVLRKGWNAILLKIASGRSSIPGGTPLVVTRPDFSPVKGLVFSTEFQAGAAPPCPPSGLEKEAVTSSPSSLDRLRAAAADEKKRGVPDCLWLAGLLQGEGLDEEARKVFEDLLSSHGACPLVRWTVAHFEESDNEYLTYDECRSRAQEGYGQTVEADPGFYPGWVSLGNLVSRKDKLKALDHFQKALALQPGAFAARNRLIRAYQDLGWNAEAWGELQEMARRHPAVHWTHFAMARWYARQGNEFERLRHLEKAVKAMESKSRDWFFNTWENLGMWDRLESYYRDRAEKRPSDAGIRGHLARTLVRLKRFDEAKAFLEEARRIDPENRWMYAILADLAGHTGDEAQLASVWREALAAPAERRLYDHQMREALAGTEGEHPSPPGSLSVDAAEIVRKAPAPSTFKKVSSVVLFEQKVVRFFGPDLAAAEERRHRIVMILNKKGGERYGRIFLPDRILQARVFTPDGKILEPDPVQEGRFIALPALDRGQIIEVDEIRFRQVTPPTRGYRSLFEESALRRPDEPVLRLRLVVIFPEGVKVDRRQRNLETEPEIVKDEGCVAHVWDLKDLKEYKREVFMPSPRKVLPWIAFSQGRPEARLLERELRSRMMEEPVADFVRKKAAELCEGREGSEAKLRALYDFCVTEIKDGWHNPVQTLRKKEGSVEGLFLALARAAGLNPMRAHFRRVPNYHAEWDAQSLSFDGSVVYIPLEGGGRVLLPQRFVPFGVFPGEACGAEALLVSRHGVAWTTLPALPAEEVGGNIRGRITLAPDGSASVEGSLVLGGAMASQMRLWFERGMSKAMRKMAVTQIVNRIFGRVRLASHEMSPFDPGVRFTTLSFKGKIMGFARRKGRTLTFRPVRLVTQASRSIIRETRREFPAVIDFGPMGLTGKEEVTYVLPPGAKARAPESRIGGGEFGRYAFSVKTEDGELRVGKDVTLYRQIVPPERWDALSRFCREVDQLESRTVEVELAEGK
ncbi:MAG: tetratricopeptide repeat protein [Planctomycetota bacterium]|jgi:tetratricopeptide (TPR) repeat protein